jgi:hypothetical protein
MLTVKDDDFRRQIQDETGVRRGWAAEAFTDLDEDVRQNIARIKASPSVPHKDDVRGFVYEVETGTLREVTQLGPGVPLPRQCGPLRGGLLSVPPARRALQVGLDLLEAPALGLGHEELDEQTGQDPEAGVTEEHGSWP